MINLTYITYITHITYISYIHNSYTKTDFLKLIKNIIYNVLFCT